jgi:hypothetical protein
MEPLRVGVLEEDEVFRRGLMAVLGEEDCACIVLGGDREMSPRRPMRKTASTSWSCVRGP